MYGEPLSIRGDQKSKVITPPSPPSSDGDHPSPEEDTEHGDRHGAMTVMYATDLPWRPWIIGGFFCSFLLFLVGMSLLASSTVFLYSVRDCIYADIQHQSGNHTEWYVPVIETIGGHDLFGMNGTDFNCTIHVVGLSASLAFLGATGLFTVMTLVTCIICSSFGCALLVRWLLWLSETKESSEGQRYVNADKHATPVAAGNDVN